VIDKRATKIFSRV